KSGTNKRVWNLQTNLRNSALDALGPDPARQKAPFSSVFQYVASTSGPIWKDHSWYLVNWDQQIRTVRPGGLVMSPVLTDAARNGIFRYWEGWDSGDAFAPPASGAWPIDPSG